MSDTSNVPVITIDGPSGTGKGTICHLLANHLNWHVLDSGCLYRVLAFAAKEKGIPLTDNHSLVKLALTMDLRFETDPHQKSRVFFENKEVFADLRTEQCGQDASKIAIVPEIREALLARQRDFAKLPGLVTDGRDMGTVVFPEALLKIYLDASLEERAKRRYLELKEKQNDASLAKVVNELAKRDARDTARLHAPLKPAEDSVLIDTTGLTIAQVFDNILHLIDKRLIRN